MNATTVLLIASLFAFTTAVGSTPLDSAQRTNEKPWSTKSTMRFHSKGMFSYGGRIASKNPAMDFTFIYDSKHWGFFVFKAADLVDRTSPNNFILAAAYKNFNVTPRLSITPNVGVFLEQTHHFAGHGSDMAFTNDIRYKIGKRLVIDHTLMLANPVIEPDWRDCVNRFRLIYTGKHLDATVFFWHNNNIFDVNTYTSSAFQIAYSRIPISKSVTMSVGFTELSVLRTSDEQSVATSHQYLATIAFQYRR